MLVKKAMKNLSLISFKENSSGIRFFYYLFYLFIFLTFTVQCHLEQSITSMHHPLHWAAYKYWLTPYKPQYMLTCNSVRSACLSLLSHWKQYYRSTRSSMKYSDAQQAKRGGWLKQKAMRWGFTLINALYTGHNLGTSCCSLIYRITELNVKTILHKLMIRQGQVAFIAWRLEGSCLILLSCTSLGQSL